MNKILRSCRLCIPIISLMTAVCNAQEVNPLTGRLRMSLPLGVIQANDISVPISINHTGGSLRIADGEGSCGLGWNLSLGGGIYRQVRGLPDEINTDKRKGWLHNNGANAQAVQSFVPTADDDLSSGSESADWNALETLHSNYMNDTEPDLFSVNAPGLSFQFVFDHTGTPRFLTHADVTIEYVPPGPGPVAFVVKTSNGIVYTFGGTMNALDMVLCLGRVGDPYEMNTAAKYIPVEFMLSNVSYVMNYKLSTITSTASGTTATFTYKSSVGNLADAASKTYYNLDSTNYLLNMYKVHELENVQLKGFKASFNWGKGILSSVRILDSVSLQERLITLRYMTGTGNSGTKLFLRQMLVNGGNCFPAEKHEFDYEGVTPSPENPFAVNVSGVDWKRNWGRDFYGYKNANLQSNVPELYFDADEENGRRLRIQEIAGANSTLLPGSNRDMTSHASFGALKRVTFPSGGYAEMVYEPNRYLDTSVTPNVEYPGPGTRVSKIILQGGEAAFGKTVTDTNSERNVEKEFQYYLSGGTVSSGRLLAPAQLGYIKANSIKKFAETMGEEPVVLYTRVLERISSKGYTVYEFSVPAYFPLTTDGDWKATKSRIARNSPAYPGNLKNGYYLFPFPPSTNYDFRRGRSTRVATYSQSNVLLSERNVYYSAYSINPITIKGLRFEKLVDTYHYGVYEILTGRVDLVSQEVTKQASLQDPSKLLQTTTTYGYNSNLMLISVTNTLPNSTTTVKTFKYARDFPFSSPPSTDTAAIALKALNTAFRGNSIVEEHTTITVPGSSTKTASAQLIVYRDFGTSGIHPYYVKSLPPGLTLSPAQMSGQNFTSDQNYRLVSAFKDYEEGKPRTTMDDKKNYGSTHYASNLTVPTATFRNARAQESVYENFEPGGTSFGLSLSGVGVELTSNSWTGDKAASFSNTTASLLSSATQLIQKNSNKYRVSCWANGLTGRKIYVKVFGSGASPIELTKVSNEWEYLEGELNTSAVSAPFQLEVKTNATSSLKVTVDDLLFMPSHARFSAQTTLPFIGLTSSTDDRGFSTKLTYDHLGRPVNSLDRQRNLVQRNEYSTKNVVPPPPQIMLKLSSDVIYVNQQTTFTVSTPANWSCDPNLTYLWEVDGVAQSGGTDGVFPYTFATVGQHRVQYTVLSAVSGNYSEGRTLCINYAVSGSVTSAVTNSQGQPASLVVDCNSGARIITLGLPEAPLGCEYNISWKKNGEDLGSGNSVTVYGIAVSGENPITEDIVASISLDCSAFKDCALSNAIAFSGQTSFSLVHMPSDCQ